MKLTDLFYQASSDFSSKKIFGRGFIGYILLGYRIIKDEKTEAIEITDPVKNGDYYTEILKEDYSFFCLKGWKKAVYELTLTKYKKKLEVLNNNIRFEKNNGNRSKTLLDYKNKKKSIMTKYYKITQKLLQL